MHTSERGILSMGDNSNTILAFRMASKLVHHVWRRLRSFYKKDNLQKVPTRSSLLVMVIGGLLQGKLRTIYPWTSSIFFMTMQTSTLPSSPHKSTTLYMHNVVGTGIFLSWILLKYFLLDVKLQSIFYEVLA